jgi:hypothetical protein
MEIAEKENMQHVFLASNATSLAVQLMTDVAQGKGSQIDSETVSISLNFLQFVLMEQMHN